MGSRACAANRSTTVKKAMAAMTTKRTVPSRTRCCWGSASIAAGLAISDMRCSLPLNEGSEPECLLPPGENGSRGFSGSDVRSSHAVLVGIPRDVRGDQNDRLLAGVLPPVRQPALLDRQFARRVHDRHFAVARVLGDRT